MIKSEDSAGRLGGKHMYLKSIVDERVTAMLKKADLPTKLCATCGRPFTWRKKWTRVWDEVRYCSARCRDQKAAGRGVTPQAAS